MDYGLKCEKYNTSRKNIRESLQDLGLGKEFRLDAQSTIHKRKILSNFPFQDQFLLCRCYC